MPKRLIDFDSLWTSSRLLNCTPKARVDYLWIYGIADAGGSFEMTSMRSIWAKVSVIRPDLTLSRLKLDFKQYEGHGLLFKWSENCKVFGHWVGSTKDGRLPSPSTKARYYLVCPYPPTEKLQEYESRFNRDQGHDSGHAQDEDLELDVEGKGRGRGFGLGFGAPVAAQVTAAKPAAALSVSFPKIESQPPTAKATAFVTVECPKCGKRLGNLEYVQHATRCGR